MSYVIASAILFGAYLMGSIPSGYLLALQGGIRDIRNHGSGNIGATNVARILGFHYFIPVFMLDGTKAFLYLMLIKGYGWSEPFLALNSLALIAGNSHSIFLQFSGGKGIATITGILLFFAPSLVLCLLCCWMVMMVCTRTVGIASAVTCLALLGCSVWWYNTNPSLSLTFFCMGAWGVWRHMDNIKRYLQLPID